jgi:signal transduction histidine kinase
MELLRAAAARHRLKAGKPVFIQLPAVDKLEVFSSRLHLNTIVDNLLQNAIRYSDARGVHIDIRLRRQEDGFLLEIADDGWGIPPKDRRQIFEKFYRSSNKDRNYTIKGMGIGLYHVKQCVDALGGSIRVRDNRPRGTVMEVKL